MGRAEWMMHKSTEPEATSRPMHTATRSRGSHSQFSLVRFLVLPKLSLGSALLRDFSITRDFVE